jgi:hypothetical protein
MAPVDSHVDRPHTVLVYGIKNGTVNNTGLDARHVTRPNRIKQPLGRGQKVLVGARHHRQRQS